MELMTVSEVSRAFGVSTRMLRYYENMGLIQSTHRMDYAYRIYDETAVHRIQQILILRKLRIPLKQIAEILDDPMSEVTTRIFHEHIAELDEQIMALDTVREILNGFITRNTTGPVNLIEDRYLAAMTDWLDQPKNTLKEAQRVDKLDHAEKIINDKLDPRIVMLPPCTVASYHHIGENPEEEVGKVLDDFIRKTRLYEIKPDSRMFGFNNPNPARMGDDLAGVVYGYESWVTIPEDMDVPGPLQKKHFKGGLYAVYTINFPEFQHWQDLKAWAEKSARYMPNYNVDGQDSQDGCMEEYLNWVYASHMGWPESDVTDKLDILLPIKARE